MKPNKLKRHLETLHTVNDEFSALKERFVYYYNFQHPTFAKQDFRP
ncbi:unnamed protein product [Acanthoscelides obtectus]|uniref:Uncharacterized protein n=1 Tax=Acanthoscelides obtectus TaxID=200917 RepID=A0A9P0L8Y0_ACAOB|nr:unnamed protein product [Acanthoscelides obtectus]CAK1646485.1 hypothetical protein AOBTE_LOCUS14657 [Acanthoscelides obtectus]